jgi:hypothetical protein
MSAKENAPVHRNTPGKESNTTRRMAKLLALAIPRLNSQCKIDLHFGLIIPVFTHF